MTRHWKGIVFFVALGMAIFIGAMMMQSYAVSVGALLTTTMLFAVYMMGEADFSNAPNR